MTAAIHFQPEAYSTTGPQLMGRNAAGESFLRGFSAHSRATGFRAYVQRPEHAQAYAAALLRNIPPERQTVVFRALAHLIKLDLFQVLP